jgi:pseudoazurin
MTKNLPISLAAAAAVALAMGSAAYATEIKVQLKNSGAQGMMVFEPGFVKVKPGDSIRFVATDQGHTVDSIDGMVPAGAGLVHGAMGKDMVFKFTKAGLYGFKCNPHAGFGMAMIVEAGDASNLAQVQAAAAKQPPLMKKRLIADLAQVK